MISPTASSTSGAGASANTPTVKGSTLGKDDFLKLLVTQLRNQDPLSPLQPDQFAAQLAQFSSVEQLTQLNSAVDAQTQALSLVTMMSKTDFGASLIGRAVSAVGNDVSVPTSGDASVRVDVGGSGGIGVLRVFDSTGKEVGKRELGPLRPGRQDLTLPSGLAPGKYTYKVDVTANDKAVPVTTYTRGVVDAVHFDERGIVLRMGSLEVTLDSIAEVEPLK